MRNLNFFIGKNKFLSIEKTTWRNSESKIRHIIMLKKGLNSKNLCEVRQSTKSNKNVM